MDNTSPISKDSPAHEFTPLAGPGSEGTDGRISSLSQNIKSPEDSGRTSFSSTDGSSSRLSGDSGFESIPAADFQDVKIGLRPSDYQAFVDKVVDVYRDFYAGQLKGADHKQFLGGSESQKREIVLAWLTDPTRMENNEKPRLEFRLCHGRAGGMCGNVALCCEDGRVRDALFKEFKTSLGDKGLDVVSAGSTTVEISNSGVDKSTPIRFLQDGDHFKQVLDDMGYQPGPSIDARRTGTVIVSDADGTIWDKPEKGQGLEENNLLNSPARSSILSYLAHGGVLVINTGNDPARTVRRFMMGLSGLSQKTKNMILSRVIFASAGGGSLAIYNGRSFQEVRGYHEFDPKTPLQGGRLDMLYLGDDPKIGGNDMPGFIASNGHYICVAPKEAEQHVKASKIEERTQYGEVKQSHSIFTGVVNQALAHRSAQIQGPLFRDMEALMANTGTASHANELVDFAIHRMGGREAMNEVVSREIDDANPPMVIQSRDVNEVTTKMSQMDPIGENAQLTYSTVMTRIKELAGFGVKVSQDLPLQKDPKADAVNAFLDQSNLVARSKEGVVTLRILEPGNNDQATPMYVASQIAYLQQEVKRRGGKIENLHIQVLVMGKGGHATTAVFPQIGQMQKVAGQQVFSGVEEAISLSGTLQEALLEAKVPCKFTTNLDGSDDIAGGVVIRLASNSTNTGENVGEAKQAHGEKAADYQWVVSATPSSRRQLLTFAHQYEMGGEKCYDTLWGMSLPRGKGFIRDHLSDHQVVTEFYAGMAEKARLVNYALMPKPFIPPFTTNFAEFKKTIDTLYETYAKLEGASVDEAKKTMKIGDLQTYFASRFATLEQSIPWSKDRETQSAHVQGAMRTLKRQANANEMRKAFAILGEFEKHHIDDASLKNSIDALRGYIKSGSRRDGRLVSLCKRVNTAYAALGFRA